MSIFPTQLPDPFATTNSSAAGDSSGFDSIDSDDFLEIILSELTNQDPLAPNDTQALLDQIGTIRQIESDLELTESLQEIASRTEISSAGSLVGTFVAGTTDNGQEVVGYVDSISISREGLRLNLGTGFTVALENVQEIVDPTLLEPPENSAPVSEAGIADIDMLAGEEFEFTFSTDTFSDADPDDVLSYAASLSDGSELPEWIEFNATSRTFTFNPAMADIGTYTLRLTATDSFGDAASTSFKVFVNEFADGDGADGG